ncbi:MAG: DUF4878 domain-containing protein [Sphingobacteriales bacterium]|nr:MAG: DUF4878 domain-containing protein [Sphingobacteriales bacterium]
MKKLFFSLAAVVLLAIGLVSCNTNTPKATADKFLNSFYHMDYKEAKTVSTEETKKMLEMIEQFATMMPDSARENAKKVKINIKDVKEEGDKATVVYTTSENTSESKLDLIKQEGKWLVQFNKQDPGTGGEAGGDPMTEEPMTEDTSGNGGAMNADTATSATTATGAQ